MNLQVYKNKYNTIKITIHRFLLPSYIDFVYMNLLYITFSIALIVSKAFALFYYTNFISF